ncbi:sensor histidine kinase [Dyadobacter sandarakinus]|uniref:histidine kinase n=1 Tax=Dyadobacter sandarakinus TaxID=2747268 RepID=A0ABX7I224_9BACT|nr:HAMP domain-containing sensor histidine kinase [Dyadobacter sandarakinus]QRQ99932.1 HAMP domain-containing histidine kinase [Dyadobacter sandarakinus]
MSPVELHCTVRGDSIRMCRTGIYANTTQKAGFSDQLTGFFGGIFDTKDWPARWHCGEWSDFHGWLYIASDLLIWASYFLIPFFLMRVAMQRRDFPFPKTIWLFIAFIILCGTSHLLDAIMFWVPMYRLSALVRLGTAIVSLGAVYYLSRIVPNILLIRSVADLQKEIDERNIVEEKLQETQRSLIRSMDQLERQHAQLKNFTHILSHNLRNHSSNISQLTNFIDEENLDANNSEIFQKIQGVSRLLNNTLDDLSQVIRIRENKLENEGLDIQEVTREVLTVMSEGLKESETDVNTEFSERKVSFPKIYLESILMNLISNGIKYRKDNEPAQIALKMYVNEEGVKELEYMDNGKGINLDLHADKIFGLYKTFHKHKEANGVGLFLIKNQIEAQGGRIQVSSKVNQGTTFKITFNEYA